MKPIIGIISRKSLSESKKNINIVYKDIYSSILKSGGIPIGIPNETNILEYLKICKGIILQGGDDIEAFNLNTIKILKEKNIPTLGICLGMQEMFYENNDFDIENHKNTYHKINILKDTLLYKILNSDTTIVNSRHKSSLHNTSYQISSISEDNIIESIEDSNKKFFLGLQWHPENIYDVNFDSKMIFDYFVKICDN